MSPACRDEERPTPGGGNEKQHLSMRSDKVVDVVDAVSVDTPRIDALVNVPPGGRTATHEQNARVFTSS